MFIDPFVVGAGLCSCNGMLMSDPVAPVICIFDTSEDQLSYY